MKRILTFLKLICNNLEDDINRRLVQIRTLSFLLGVICFYMSVLNIVSKKELLLLSTVFGCIAFFIIYVLTILFPHKRHMISVMFCLAATAIFTGFIINGGTEGFSTIWLLLVPALGMSVFGVFYGTAWNVVVAIELIFFFYFPAGRELLQCEYTNSFLVRFPILYISFYFISFYLELMRKKLYDELIKTKNEYQYMYSHDALTGVYNRYGFNELVCKSLNDKNKEFSFFIIDIDYFKSVNDRYGHIAGDYVLSQTAKIIKNTVCDSAQVCRWGGEEFAVINKVTGACNNVYEKANGLCEAIEAEEFSFNEHKIKITISLGGVYFSGDKAPSTDEIFLKSDKALYEAKNLGRNRAVITQI